MMSMGNSFVEFFCEREERNGEELEGDVRVKAFLKMA